MSRRRSPTGAAGCCRAPALKASSRCNASSSPGSSWLSCAKIDQQLVDIDRRVVEAVTASKSTLTDIVGIGPILAATIIGHAGDEVVR